MTPCTTPSVGRAVPMTMMIQLMTPCTAQSSVGRAVPMTMMDTTTAQSSVGRAVPMTMMDTTYDSLHHPVKCW